MKYQDYNLNSQRSEDTLDEWYKAKGIQPLLPTPLATHSKIIQAYLPNKEKMVLYVIYDFM